MSSARERFRTAVDKATRRSEREDAVDALADAGECDKLAILVQMDGLSGPLRRRALDGLGEAGCTEVLDALVENGGLEESLEADAEQLL